MQDISLATDLGWDITLDLENKQFIFGVYYFLQIYYQSKKRESNK